MVILQRSCSEYLLRWGSYSGVKTKVGALACKLHLLKDLHLCHLSWHTTLSPSVMSLSVSVSQLTWEIPEDRGQIGFILDP